MTVKNSKYQEYKNLSEDYISDKFFQYCGVPTYNKASNVYQGSCPICREGSSWLMKRRCFYLPKEGYICCHNCQEKWSPIRWIAEVSGMSFKEIWNEHKSGDYSSINVDRLLEKYDINEKSCESLNEQLPKDAINLFDKVQMQYWASHHVVKAAVEEIKRRRIDLAYNTPKALYVSLNDYIHKNRLIFPFYDRNDSNTVLFYQSRSLFKEQEEHSSKYISKFLGKKTVFGIETVDADFDYLFIFEGLIDSLFVKNGVAIGGVEMSSLQNEQLLNHFPFHNRIWVLDNQQIDETSRQKTLQLLEKEERVFIWEKTLSEFKDFNDIMVSLGRNQLSHKYVIENSFKGLKGKMKL